MWSFDWSVFWAALAAFGIVQLVMHVLAIGFPLNVSLSLYDFQAIVGKLESIESYLMEQQNVDGDDM